MSEDVKREIAPSGTLRAAINFGNPVLAQKDPASGAPRGVSVDIANELGRRLGLPIAFVAFDAAGKVFEALSRDAWDVAFLAIDPKRATEIDFTPPYVIIEGSYMVPADSPLKVVDDVDRPGVRIAVGNGSAYELYLSRTIKHARIVRAPTGNEAIAMFERDKLDAVAGVKSPLERFAQSRPDLRVMDGRFMVIEQAIGVPKGRTEAVRYLRSMIEELKARGFVAEGLARSGQRDALVAPAAG
ncbi:MAG TPA: ABC transporter substrate-binding protein [Casimicrobiaceae bacterium]|nr:ABC transporter substrate-binding protein [Casimicrobiaceae bacterium]